MQGPTPEPLLRRVQISKYVEREIVNHKQLRHPHIVELREAWQPLTLDLNSILLVIRLQAACMCLRRPA
jgi:hypothetical protein